MSRTTRAWEAWRGVGTPAGRGGLAALGLAAVLGLCGASAWGQAGDAAGGASGGASGGGAAAELVLPRSMRPSPVIWLLQRAEYAEAVALAQRELSASPDRAEALMLRGLAQFGVAAAGGDRDALREAGLSFMTVVVLHPDHALAGPARVEAGAVHLRLGRPGLARALLSEAEAWLDPAAEPAYARRRELLLAEARAAAGAAGGAGGGP